MKKVLLMIMIAGLFTKSSGQSFSNFSNRQMQFQQLWMGRNMRMNSKALSKLSYNFLITFEDNTSLIVKSQIHTDTSLRKTYLIYENTNLPKSDPNYSRKIYVNETKKIATSPKYLLPVEGIATDSCWMFQIIYGPVNAYSYLPDSDAGFFPETFIGLQAGNGKVISFNKDNLQLLLAKNAKAMKLIKRGDYIKAIHRYNDDFYKPEKK